MSVFCTDLRSITAQCSVIRVQIEGVDLLQVITVPFTSPGVDFETGYDEFPAFNFKSNSIVKASSRLYISDKMFMDFALLITFRADNENGGYLFAVVDPQEIVVQFGVELVGNGNGLRNLTLYYTDSRRHMASESLASFAVPNRPNEWTRLAFKVFGNQVTLYYDCNEYGSVRVSRRHRLVFHPASVLYLAQAGKKIGNHFELLPFFHKNFVQAESDQRILNEKLKNALVSDLLQSRVREVRLSSPITENELDRDT
uniref:Thrombospondin-like N-terminal domain-containing protein n=1 Tax=Strigamia maritima TaxID=126957 RepID=T1JM15_STRMM